MGFQADLHLSDKQFFNCLMMFCMSKASPLHLCLINVFFNELTLLFPVVGYMVFMLPANLGMRIIGPPPQVGLAVIFFGTCSTCMAAAKSYGAVMGLRVLTGSEEAFIQVALLYFSFWYKRDEVASRAAFYYTSATISGCFSGLIAYAVQKNLDGVHDLRSWQWLYIVEGVPALAIGFIIIFCLPSFLEIVAKKGSWLFKKEEIDLALQRMDEGVWLL